MIQELGKDKTPLPIKKQVSRRTVIGSAIAALLGSVGFFLGKKSKINNKVWLRPPGSLPENEFLTACVRCTKCANACPNNCISFHDFSSGIHHAFTPKISARERGCILCGECATACPSGAIRPFEATREGWKKNVNMGIARVNKDMCYSFHGRTCGACYRACPLAGEAMKIGVFETPLVQYDTCVGCGLCEQACLHLPQAIRVIPNRGFDVG